MITYFNFGEGKARHILFWGKWGLKKVPACVPHIFFYSPDDKEERVCITYLPEQ